MKTLNDLKLIFRHSHKFDKKVLYSLYENLKEVTNEDSFERVVVFKAEIMSI